MALGLALAIDHKKVSSSNIYDVIIVGGGLAGLTCAVELGRAGRKVLLIEKKAYPYHKVCGEYISNEVLPYLRSLGFDPIAFGAADIRRLRLSTPAGKNIYTKLDLGGFGISRYTIDNELGKLAVAKGAEVLTGTKVTDIAFTNGLFTVANNNDTYAAKLVIGSYGKRDTLDKKLKREFIRQHTGYTGVKYHIEIDYPADEIGLDNFKDGYCGISKVEGNTYNLCYLSYRAPKDEFKSIPELEEKVLFKNPVLRDIFSRAKFKWDAPLVITQISFAPKKPVENNILMCGDTAGLITPLCGNGMSMAIGGAKLLTGLIEESGILQHDQIPEAARKQLEGAYEQLWNKRFKTRLYWGRTIQRFFGNTGLTSTFLNTVHAVPPLERKLISLTHGEII
jgi:flavin-dependent dehydrogenase